MKIIDIKKQKPVHQIATSLTIEQAGKMIASLNCLIDRYGQQGQHEHISDTSHTREITIALYDDKDLSKFSFDQLAMKLLRDEL
jgi:alpha-D-ribose 1-methylphosphonate 5-triphosphate diphosphatase PhnM